MTLRDALPRSWTDNLTEGLIGVGMDIATTDGPNSNPASITVSQLEGVRIFERLVISWKTRDEAVAEGMLTMVCADIAAAGKRIKGGSIDASNEVFFAQRLAKKLRQYCPWQLMKGGENVTFQGVTLPSKEMLGNLYVNAYADGLIATAEGAFIKEDRRLVTKNKGRFVTLTGKGGKHGDTFDSGKHARWALLSSGSAEAMACGVSSFASSGGNNPFNRTAEDEDLGFSEAFGLSC